MLQTTQAHFNIRIRESIYLLLGVFFILTGFNENVFAQSSLKKAAEPIVISEQGSFTVGGSVVSTNDGGTFHGDHAYVFYQKPVDARKYPLVFLHGIYQFSKTWETTPDGREGFQNIFLRRGFATFNVTQPRRGNAGRSTVSATIDPIPDEQLWFNRFRVGIWPDYFEGVQFSRDNEALNQYMRQITPNIGPIDLEVNSNALADLFDQLGGAIFVSHSHGGAHTWLTVPKTNNIKGIVAWEPGGMYSFPNDEPRPKTDFPDENEYILVSSEVFETFTKIPTLIIYGDYIPDSPSGNPEQDEWGVRLQLARQWAEAVNNRGGDVTVIHLPEIGIKGNTHFPFSDLNNIEMADLMSEFLHQKGLD